jgi:RNA polymerase sigma-70 factor (ECF subfamily)
MASSPTNNVLQPLYRAALLRDGAGLTDGDLLEGFVHRRDAAYFEALVRRHGPMVLGVCRRILGDPHDAEDAFQATFLVLVRRAASVLPRDMVGNWLHGVAYRTALQARRAAARRRARERQVHNMPDPVIEEQATWQELRPLLDQELDRLPAKYRAAVVLCYLEGRTLREAAGTLRLPVGTLSGRLTTARRLLARRLRRRGLTVSGAVLVAALAPGAASGAVPASLIASTVQAGTLLATGKAAIASVVSANVAALTKAALKTVLVAKLKLATAVVLSAVLVGGTAAAFVHRGQDAGGPQAPAVAASQATAPETGGPTRDQPPRRTAAASETPADKSDKARLQGTWTPIGSLVAGVKKDPNDAKLKPWKLVFEGDRVTLPGGDRVPYKLNPRKNPKQIDIELDADPIPIHGIYEFDGDKLRLSWVKSGERPVNFDTAKNDSVLIVFAKQRRSKAND